MDSAASDAAAGDLGSCRRRASRDRARIASRFRRLNTLVAAAPASRATPLARRGCNHCVSVGPDLQPPTQSTDQSDRARAATVEHRATFANDGSRPSNNDQEISMKSHAIVAVLALSSRARRLRRACRIADQDRHDADRPPTRPPAHRLRQRIAIAARSRRRRRTRMAPQPDAAQPRPTARDTPGRGAAKTLTPAEESNSMPKPARPTTTSRRRSTAR